MLPALGGLCTGLVALAFPEILYQGYSNVNALLELRTDDYAPGLLLQMLAAKVLATAVCGGSGLVGGIYAPSIFMGARPLLQLVSLCVLQALVCGIKAGLFRLGAAHPLCSCTALMPQYELHKRPSQLLVQERARCSTKEWQPKILLSADVALGATRLTTSGAHGDAGAALGSAFGGIAQATFAPTGLAVAAPAAYALVGVAGMLAANCQVPLTAVLLLFELTHDYFIIVRPSSPLVIQV